MKLKHTKKIRKTGNSVFGRFSIIASALIVQLAVVIFLIETAVNYFLPVQIISYIFSFIALIHLISRDMLAEMKLPWVFFLLLIPLSGPCIYFLLSENRMSPGKKRLLMEIKALSYEFYKLPESVYDLSSSLSIDETSGEELKEENPDGTSCYVNSSTGFAPFRGIYTEYYCDGESFWEALCRELSKAENFIFLEYFIVEHGVMFDRILEILKERIKKGVEVRLLYDDIGSINKVAPDFWKEMNSFGIKCHRFNPFVPLLSAVQNNRDHRKITVIDGKTGFIGGTNLADEYINEVERFGKWKDSSILIKGKAVRSLTLMFLQMYALQNKKVEDFSVYLNVETEFFPKQGFVQPYGDGPKPIYNEMIAENTYLNIINTSKRYLWIMTPYYVVDKKITDSLILAARRGVDVRIITPHIPDKKVVYLQTKRSYKTFVKNGVKIYEYEPGFIHSKNVLCDDECAVCGTINFDYRSFCHHYECAVYLKGTDTVLEMKRDFENTFQECIAIDEESATLSLPARAVATLGILFTPLI